MGLSTMHLAPGATRPPLIRMLGVAKAYPSAEGEVESLKPLEFDIPQAATETGELTLSWFGEPGLGGNGRGCQVSEAWLIKEPAASGR